MSTSSRSRRSFLKLAGVTLAATTLTCCGATAVAMQSPTVDFYETQGGNVMTDKILIAYASRYGSTGEVAKVLAETLAARGKSVEVRLAKAVTSLEGYQAVVVGSGVRMGSWMPEAVSFVKSYRERLTQLPTVFYTLHGLNRGDDEASRVAREAYTAPMRALVTPQAEAFFGGVMDLKRMSLLDGLISRAVMSATHAALGDYREWDKIRGWAQTILA